MSASSRMMSSRKPTNFEGTYAVLLTLLVVMSMTTVKTVAAQSSCSSSFPAFNASAAGLGAGPRLLQIFQSVELWQGIVLIVGFGTFAVFIAFVFLLVRKFIYFDSHLLDTFFDAGGQNNFAIVASAIVARYLWTSSYTSSTFSAFEAGVAGGFFLSAGSCLHVLLFAIAAYEFRVKSPGAKTYLQVIHCRFGAVPHITVMIFAFFVNIIVSGLIMMEGTRILTSLTSGIDHVVVCIILTVAVCIYTVIGGVGGGIYMAYFAVACVVSLALTYFFGAFYSPVGWAATRLFPAAAATDHQSAIGGVCAAASCAVLEDPDAVVRNNSVMTFFSLEGLCQGVIIMATGFAPLFVNQSFWTGASLAKPPQAVWGYLTAGLAYFAIPFVLSFTFGMSFWALAVQQGDIHGTIIFNETQSLLGYLPVVMSQQLMGRAGDFMMYALTLCVVITAVSSEVLSMSAIFMYDIYGTYINPFVATADVASKSTPVIGQWPQAPPRCAAVKSDYLRYNKRAVKINYVVVAVFSLLVFPVALILHVVAIDGRWLYNALGVVCGSAVAPVILSVAWYRTTGPGVVAGCVTGLVTGLVTWFSISTIMGPGIAVDFRESTSYAQAIGPGAGVAVIIGGVVCALFSACCGGCDPARNAEREWEKCWQLDNPVTPWAAGYGGDAELCGRVNRCTGQPHYYQLRQKFKAARSHAYYLSFLIVFCVAVAWPSLMLTAGIFSCATFAGWAIVVAVWGVIAAAFLCLVPPLLEMFTVCRQAYYNRMCEHSKMADDYDTTSNRFPQQPGALQTVGYQLPAVVMPPRPAAYVGPAPVGVLDVQPVQYAGTVFHAPDPRMLRSSIGSDYAVANNNNAQGQIGLRLNTTAGGDVTRSDRWKTFIHLD